MYVDELGWSLIFFGADSSHLTIDNTNNNLQKNKSVAGVTCGG